MILAFRYLNGSALSRCSEVLPSRLGVAGLRIGSIPVSDI